MKFMSEREKLAVAEDPKIREEVLKVLSRDEGWAVIAQVVGDSNTLVRALEAWSHNEDREVRAAVARNPNTPREVLEELSHDKSDYIRKISLGRLK